MSTPGYPKAREVVHDEFRHVELDRGPGAGPWIRASAHATVATGVCGGIVLASEGRFWYALFVPILTSYAQFKRAKEQSPFGRRVAMRMAPWGFVLDPEGSPEVLRWPQMQDVKHQVVPISDERAVSMVFVTVGGRVCRSACPVSPRLARLPSAFPWYVTAATMPIALDLEGAMSMEGDKATFGELLGRAKRMLESPDGTAQLGMPAAGYRGVASRAPGHETAKILRGALVGHRREVDEGPLAAILAAKLGTRELIPEILLLCMSPSPFVAAVGKAAALRLGAPPMRPGAVDEVLPFLPEDEVRAIERFAKGDDAG
ncbi:hypothetical protein [Polyangium spumosum]|uniref:Uncharacterized protein n=1 Tax=Polyangium spumosum TaxID=889282 RepID=A0A6N7PF12_9BACT|nr:hypothetical protein [Polyangium spumosum]MRG90692.1 hypothetical protein [Polyangium spumosum]